MLTPTTATLLTALTLIGSASSAPLKTLKKRADAYVDPTLNGGSWLDKSGGLGEPLNVIIAGTSTEGVLNEDGLLSYSRSLGFSEECFGLHIGDPQTANLGDGDGDVNEGGVYREDFGNTDVGTCFESLAGGNHFRYWQQDGAQANTRAWFLAASTEEDVSEGHTISPDGYNTGRDAIVSAASKNDGVSEFDGKKYKTTIEWIQPYEPTNEGINHNITVDGRVAILTVADA